MLIINKQQLINILEEGVTEKITMFNINNSRSNWIFFFILRIHYMY